MARTKLGKSFRTMLPLENNPGECSPLRSGVFGEINLTTKCSFDLLPLIGNQLNSNLVFPSELFLLEILIRNLEYLRLPAHPTPLLTIHNTNRFLLSFRKILSLPLHLRRKAAFGHSQCHLGLSPNPQLGRVSSST
ncbi:unnamed protein product [Orchesella dallaii]|uniref:Uncharacterized protein n=1 Tax=Orchesella dallaii TaxID=48710 RepID=A0ABP1R4K6_9HEXA